MQTADVLKLIEAESDERGIAHWDNLGERRGGLRSFGIGLTKLRKLAKQIGRDRELAQALWKSDIYEARIIALLIDDPKKITREQAEQQVDQLHSGMLAHVFSSCDATLAKTPFAIDLADQWIRHGDRARRGSGYGLLYETSKFSEKKAPSDEFFLEHVALIAQTFNDQPEGVRMAMGLALMGIGKRNAVLNEAALNVAQTVGPIEFTSASGTCEPFDVARHLTTERLRTKLGILNNNDSTLYNATL
ncbi:DNA alkylation repair protein [Pseudohongiella sp. O18]|uniref:DNA alkylation repair protein n=1 Tax=Pseudohongiella sp. O18 TaxID=2904248 RepID=UPI001F1CE195|nr:DNA alkylation repair protein [Pseudohongiella sp. O18]